jgi:O-acetylhomoserine/O-acetylserine sulfhydrylase-like pyridoxal-dependent enzyme
MAEIYTRLVTQLVHAGEPLPRIADAVEMPILQSATYTYAGERRYDDVRFLRSNNTPSQLAVHAKLAMLEGAEAALVRASGTAARCASFGCPTLLRPDTLVTPCATI